MMGAPRIFSWRLFLHLFLLRPFLKLFFGVNVAGKENFIGLDRFIVAANHNSHLDILLLFSVMPIRHVLKTHPVAAEDYFSQSKFLRWLVDRLFRPVWVARGAKDADPLRGMRKRLASGGSIIIFPEGTRGAPGRIGRFRSGVGRLAEKHRDVPILPVFLSGPERSFPKRSRIPLPLWNRVVVGPPQVFLGSGVQITASLERTLRELSESETADRHRRGRRPRTSFTVAVLGIDGSGKSTLSRRVSKSLSGGAGVCLVGDRLEFFEGGNRKKLQPLLTEKVREAVGGYAKRAKSLEQYKIPKLAELLLRDHLLGQVRRWFRPDVIVQDGSPLLNLAAWAVLYREEFFRPEVCAKAIGILSRGTGAVGRKDPVFREFPEVASLRRFRLTNLELPDAVILLDVEPAVSCRRIRRRGEEPQVHEKEEKLARLRKGYLMVCEVVEKEFNIPTRVLDGSLDVDPVTESALGFIRGIPGKVARRG